MPRLVRLRSFATHCQHASLQVEVAPTELKQFTSAQPRIEGQQYERRQVVAVRSVGDLPGVIEFGGKNAMVAYPDCDPAKVAAVQHSA